MDEGEENNEQPPKYGFWKSWVISFKKGEVGLDQIFILILSVAVVIFGGLMLLMTLANWLF